MFFYFYISQIWYPFMQLNDRWDSFWNFSFFLNSFVSGWMKPSWEKLFLYSNEGYKEMGSFNRSIWWYIWLFFNDIDCQENLLSQKVSTVTCQWVRWSGFLLEALSSITSWNIASDNFINIIERTIAGKLLWIESAPVQFPPSSETFSNT